MFLNDIEDKKKKMANWGLHQCRHRVFKKEQTINVLGGYMREFKTKINKIF